MDTRPDVSVVIPVFNSAPILAKLAEELERFVQGRPETFEVLFVVDGSPDASWDVVRSVSARAPGLYRGFKLSRNFGQHNATLCGMAFSRGSLLVTMDDDLQHDPRDIAALLDCIGSTGADIVVARLREKKHSLGRRAASAAIRKLTEWLLHKPKGLHLSSFRVFRRKTARAMLKISTAYPYLPALMFAVTSNVGNVEVDHHARYGGTSNYSLVRMVALASKLIVNNSSLMLDLLGLVGTLSAAVSFAGAVLVAGKKLLYGVPVPGWTSLLVSLYLIGGLLLMGLGVIGKYLLRILRESSRLPVYFVSDTTGGAP